MFNQAGIFIYICLIFCTNTLFGSVQAEPVKIKFAYIGSDKISTFQGIRQGLDEANLQGRFLGKNYSVDVISTDNIQSINASSYSVLLTSIDSEKIITISRLFRHHPVFNLAADDDYLRDICLDNVLHIVPSKHMKNDAVKQWQNKYPGSQVEAKAWHYDFFKYAASDLNKRFYESFNSKMDDAAWAGWAAVKMIADSIARETAITPGTLLDYLKTELIFDGQKGIRMSFRETGQLRQPLLITENEKLIGEVPVKGIAEINSLDSLGITGCSK